MAERTNAQSLTVTAIAIALVLGALIAWAGSDNGDRTGDMPVFALCGALAFAINWLACIPSTLTQPEHFYDLTGGIACYRLRISR